MDSLGNIWKHIYSGPRNRSALWTYITYICAARHAWPVRRRASLPSERYQIILPDQKAQWTGLKLVTYRVESHKA